jgi:hypothetical protein
MVINDPVPVQDEKLSTKQYIILGAVLCVVLGFFMGKVYTNYDIGKNYKCFVVDDVKEICSQCRYADQMNVQLEGLFNEKTENNNATEETT